MLKMAAYYPDFIRSLINRVVFESQGIGMLRRDIWSVRFRRGTKYRCGEVEPNNIDNSRRKGDVSRCATGSIDLVEFLVDLDSTRYFLLRLSIRTFAPTLISFVFVM